MGRGAVRAGVGLLLVGGLILLLVWAAQRKLIYFPDRAAPATWAGARDVTLRTEDGLALTAWLVEPPPGTPASGVGVLVAPGNGGNRLGRVPLGDALARRGLTVLLLEYRGYGGNPGRPTEDGLTRDAEAARAFLGFPAERLLYYGESLGAAVATRLAAGHAPAGLILRSPFVDLAAAGRAHYPFLPVGALLRDRFPVAGLIGGIAVPTVVIYGTADRVVPPAQSVAVAGRAAGPVRVVVVPGADHNDAALVHGDQVIDAVAELARQIA